MVRGLDSSECWMPPAQCRVTWSLKSSQEVQVNLKFSVPSPEWISLYISGMFLTFFLFFSPSLPPFLFVGRGREESNFEGR